LDLWFGGTGIPLSRRSLPETSRRGTKLAKAGGVTPWRFASKAGFSLVANGRDAHGRDQDQH
ncbi:MAG TPA: hypothetical protein VF866_01945, partial [Xanthobacteraceae bacterium]